MDKLIESKTISALKVGTGHGIGAARMKDEKRNQKSCITSRTGIPWA
jgi:hypothetical protein